MISNELKNRIITSLFLLLIFLLMFFNNFILVSVLLIFSIIIFFEFISITSNQLLRFLIFIYLSLFNLYIIFIYFDLFNIIINKLIFFYPIFITILSDTGGYFFGKIIGGKKLTKISPNKTISGSIGSFITCLLFLPLFYKYFLSINFLIFIFITIFISFVSQCGDLFISFLKRQSNKKDTGSLLPGHGGLLDRFDGAIFSLPIGFFTLMYNIS